MTKENPDSAYAMSQTITIAVSTMATTRSRIRHALFIGPVASTMNG
jgi:hypothetical protein